MSAFKKNPNGSGNEVLSGEGFYISYNSNPLENANPMHRMELVMMSGIAGLVVGGDFSNDQEEAALYDRKADKFYILKGDFRKEYAKAAKDGLKACKAVYQKHKAKHDSDWSTK